MPSRAERALVAAAATSLTVSTVFPVVAALLPPERITRAAGVADVALAAAVIVQAAVIDVRGRARIGAETVAFAYRAYRAFCAAPLALLAVFFASGDSVRWDVLLPGLAWRSWVLLYFMPPAHALWTGAGAGATTRETDSPA